MLKKDQPAKLAELTADLQRLQADFENYRKRIDVEKRQVQQAASVATIAKLLPVIDTIERAVGHAPAELADNAWAQGVVSVGKNLDKALGELGLTRIAAMPGTHFDPNLHEAVTMDEAKGSQEVVAEELRAGYMLDGYVIRPSMVKVTRQ
ncbi:MAG TPA: nucleotide exchange factor GrpE [Magnetospirillaceae bacterium]|nr:nucleotide exchange factor GrpE [Magnetospirillaceae bacterium]